MVHRMKYMGKHLFRRGEGTVGNDSFYLNRKIQPCGHKNRCASHGGSVEKNLHIPLLSLWCLIQHPMDPPECIQPVFASEPDILSFTLPMGAFIHQKHPVSMFQIVVGQSNVIAHAIAGITVKTNHCPCAFFSFKVRAVKLQSVP